MMSYCADLRSTFPAGASALLAACLACLAGGCTRSETPAPPARLIKLGTVLPDSHPTVQAMRFFKDRVESLSGGRLKVNLFPSSQLGSADEMTDGCRTGDVEMAQISAAVLAEYIPLANALSMPFIFRDAEHQARVLDGEVLTMLNLRAGELGLEVLGFLDAGTRNITTKKGPITSPDDLRGLKIRVMDAKLMVDSINALGASAVAMNQGEVFTALQQGLLDGWENNPQTIVTFRMYETGCVYYAWTRHLSIADLFLASRRFLDSLGGEERAWFDQALDETIDKQRAIWKEETEKALALMSDKGMRINELDTAPFRARVEPIYDKYSRLYGEEFRLLCERIRSTP